MIATVRAGDYWDRVKEEQPSFVRDIGPHRIVDLAILTEDEAETRGRQLGLSPEQVKERSEGTLGSLIVDRSEMAREYERLQEPPLYGSAPASRLLDAAKLLHAARQPSIRDKLLRAVAEHVLGTQPFTDEQWRFLKERVVGQRFGSFQNSVFETYAPFLEEDRIVTFRPDLAAFLRLERVIKDHGDAEAMF
jgi:hypothetical protein